MLQPERFDAATDKLLAESLSVVLEPGRNWRHKKINPVNDAVMAIRISPQRVRREFVKEIFVQFSTYEVAHALDEDLCTRLGSAFSSKDEQQRLVGILLALSDGK